MGLLNRINKFKILNFLFQLGAIFFSFADNIVTVINFLIKFLV
jgi:hypothetical protein